MAPRLTVTLLDVGWGDSIFLHSIDSNGDHHFALVDAHDTRFLQPSRIYLRRFFRRHRDHVGALDKPYLDFVLLSHDHADHRAGLESIMREFGTVDFWYPKTEITADLGRLLDFAERERNKDDGCILHHEPLDIGKPLGKFGDVEMQVLWPPADHDYENATPNNTSVILSLCLGNRSVALTGDAEEEVWNTVADNLPNSTRFFKVPHHGSVNGTFGADNSTPWYDECYKYARLGISGDLYGTFVFPSPEVITLFEGDNRKYFRTDLHHHVSFWTDGDEYDVRYTH
jgi:beta-lactamase superfamily II metal-dependent hydrolase